MAVNRVLLGYLKYSRGLGNPLSGFVVSYFYPFLCCHRLIKDHLPPPPPFRPVRFSIPSLFSRDSLVTLGITDGHGPPLLEWVISQRAPTLPPSHGPPHPPLGGGACARPGPGSFPGMLTRETAAFQTHFLNLRERHKLCR